MKGANRGVGEGEDGGRGAEGKKEIFRNSSLFNTSFVLVERTSEHLSLNFLSDSQSIVYCNTVNTFSAQILLSKKALQRPISGRTKYFFARIEKYYF